MKIVEVRNEMCTPKSNALSLFTAGNNLSTKCRFLLLLFCILLIFSSSFPSPHPLRMCNVQCAQQVVKVTKRPIMHVDLHFITTALDQLYYIVNVCVTGV